MSDSKAVFLMANAQAARALKNIERARAKKKNAEYYRDELSQAVKDMVMAVNLLKAGK
jgi:hypothetical protein